MVTPCTSHVVQKSTKIVKVMYNSELGLMFFHPEKLNGSGRGTSKDHYRLPCPFSCPGPSRGSQGDIRGKSGYAREMF